MSIEAVPNSLKAILKYTKTAKQIERVDPLMTFFCRSYACQVGIEERKKKSR